MANAFSKEERVAFEDMMIGFEDESVLSKNVSVYRTGDQQMERASDTVWRPQPYIAQSFNGLDQTANFQDNTQLSVPATLGFSKSVPWTLDAKQLRDQLQEGRIYDSAKQKLASDINVALMNTAANEGTLVVKRTAASTGFTDVAEADAVMREQGVQSYDRYFAYSPRDYNAAAANLASRTLQVAGGKSLTAYERAYVGNIAGFETYKLDYANQLTAAAGVTVTVTAAESYTPVSTTTVANGGQSNVDNRTMTVGFSVTSGTMAVGDCFTIANVNSVNHITKQSTGQLKTFRVTSLLASAGATGDMTISPPIISGTGGTDAELQYQNVDAAAAAGAAVVFLNTVTAPVNIFWQKDAIEILPGRYSVPSNTGVAVMRASTSQGIECVLTKFFDIDTLLCKYRVDTLFGTVMKQPEMAGVMLFSQT